MYVADGDIFSYFSNILINKKMEQSQLVILHFFRSLATKLFVLISHFFQSFEYAAADLKFIMFPDHSNVLEKF
jgi:hypothetical protein